VSRAEAIRHWSSRRGRAALLVLRSLALLLFLLCVIEIFRLTLTPSPASVGIAHTNLHPFSTIRLYLRYGSLREQLLQIGGNMAIGVPMGFLLPQITPRLRGLLRVVLVTVVAVTLLELAQHAFVAGRSFDVDDIILAAAGAAVGYVPLGRMFGMRLHPHHLHWWQRMLASGAERRTRTPKGATRPKGGTKPRTTGGSRNAPAAGKPQKGSAKSNSPRKKASAESR
jgi:hypothetical protein